MIPFLSYSEHAPLSCCSSWYLPFPKEKCISRFNYMIPRYLSKFGPDNLHMYDVYIKRFPSVDCILTYTHILHYDYTCPYRSFWFGFFYDKNALILSNKWSTIANLVVGYKIHNVVFSSIRYLIYSALRTRWQSTTPFSSRSFIFKTVHYFV